MSDLGGEIKIDLDELEPAKAAGGWLPVRQARSYARGKFPDFRPQFGGPIRAMPELCEIKGCGELASVLDHCHETGRFRGWLCMSCNIRLGKLGDNVASVRTEAARILPFLTYMEAFEALPTWQPPPQLRGPETVPMPLPTLVIASMPDLNFFAEAIA